MRLCKIKGCKICNWSIKHEVGSKDIALEYVQNLSCYQKILLFT